MVIIVIVNNKGIGGCTCITGPDKAVGPLIFLLVESCHETLHKRAVDLPHLLSGDPGRVFGHIGGDPGVVTVVLVHLEPADSFADDVLLEMPSHDLLGLFHRIVRKHPVPLGVSACVWLDLRGYVAVWSHSGIDPKIDLDPLCGHILNKRVWRGEPSRIPLVGARIRPRHPTRLKADDRKREVSLFKLVNLFLNLFVGI